MNWMLKIVASATLKTGVAYAAQIAATALAALKAVLNAGTISDDARKSLSAVTVVLAAVSDFLGKLSAIIGAPVLPLASSSLADSMINDAEKLDKITDAL